MAKTILFLLLAILSSATATTRNHHGHGDKLTRFHFYIHDIPVAAKPTAVEVAGAPSFNKSPVRFSRVSVVDDPITETPDPKSRILGRVQGLYAFSSQTEASLSVFLNIVFTDKKYNGSQINFLGQDPLGLKVREMPIVGGTGAFRFAKGYVEFRTLQFDPSTGNAILDTNVYVVRSGYF
ncbi:PREDICTED: dirigent protein 21-like [Tarenaya hassleriana]|uniref:dirigent protein 21-like n=1 Tax=Tarenaya hassleriana TaxID=28532 RepID=UPI00053C573E|nr:PREDICTED: dirigent protein 21-like [Tarenaya hassleriana]